jgi:hypothetical protein
MDLLLQAAYGGHDAEKSKVTVEAVPVGANVEVEEEQVKGRNKRGSATTEETRMRNKKHAKSSRARKKLFIEGLQNKTRMLSGLNSRCVLHSVNIDPRKLTLSLSFHPLSRAPTYPRPCSRLASELLKFITPEDLNGIMNQYGQDVCAVHGAAVVCPQEYNDSPSPTLSPTGAPMLVANQLFSGGSNTMAYTKLDIHKVI